jgi:tuberous sclerosis 2
MIALSLSLSLKFPQLASLVSLSLKNTKNQTPYASNWLERLRKIKSLKAKLLKDQNQSASDRNVSMPISSAATGSSSSTYDLSTDEINMADFTIFT